MNVRAAAANVLFQVVDKGHSLSHALPAAQKTIKPRDHALLQEICYGALRYLPRLESIANELMDNSLKGKNAFFITLFWLAFINSVLCVFQHTLPLLIR